MASFKKFLDIEAHSDVSDSSSDNNDDNDNNSSNGSSGGEGGGGIEQSGEFDINGRGSFKDFVSSLFVSAKDSGWEAHETAKLGALVFANTNVKAHKLIKLIFKSVGFDPMVISCLEDEHIVTSSSKKLSIVRQLCDDLPHFTSVIGICLEEGIFDLNDTKVVKKLVKYGDSFSKAVMIERRSFLAKICNYCDTKEACGKIVCKFLTSSSKFKEVSDEDKVSFISYVMSLSFFMDLPGKLEPFLVIFEPHYGSVLTDYVKQEFHISKEGELMDSDEDENGNLNDFVTYSDSDEENSGDSFVADDDDDDDDDENVDDNNMNDINEYDDVSDDDDDDDDDDGTDLISPEKKSKLISKPKVKAMKSSKLVCSSSDEGSDGSEDDDGTDLISPLKKSKSNRRNNQILKKVSKNINSNSSSSGNKRKVDDKSKNYCKTEPSKGYQKVRKIIDDD